MPQPQSRHITIVTDAWAPQTNGVVRTLEETRAGLERLGHKVTFITPQSFRNFPCPTYPEIRLSWPDRRRFTRLMDSAAPAEGQPRYIHISTEGPLGLAARAYCQKRGYRFTTAYHTRFPEYVEARFAIPTRWTYGYIRWFHKPATAIMCATAGLADELAAHGMPHSRRWSRGVDTSHFTPARRTKAMLPEAFRTLPKPLLLYVGRVAVEKNIEAFLKLDTPGSKIVVGGGPALAGLKGRYPDAHFLGPRYGDDLADIYAASDVFVFPSRTDTFGLVLLEALASGTPVAAFPVRGPLDVIGEAPVGCLHEDLALAIRTALLMSRDQCRSFALEQSWDACTRQFLASLAVA